PKPVLNPSRAGWRFWLKLPVLLPVLFWKMLRSETRVRRLARSLPQRLREELLPAFAAETQREAGQDLSTLDTPALLARLEHWIQRTLYDFARDSLKPTALAGIALKNIENALVPALKQEGAAAAVAELSIGVRPDT